MTEPIKFDATIPERKPKEWEEEEHPQEPVDWHAQYTDEFNDHKHTQELMYQYKNDMEAKYHNLMTSANEKSDYIVKLLDRIEFLKEWIAGR